jgi:hypothetical protein
VWHPIIVRLLAGVGFFAAVQGAHMAGEEALFLLISIVLTFVLALRPIGTPTNMLLRTRFSFLMKDSVEKKNE